VMAQINYLQSNLKADIIISWGIILGLTAFCFVKVFAKKELK